MQQTTLGQWTRAGASPRSQTLQRLFSTFPGGFPGIGLLVLRVAIGLSGTIQGSLILTDRNLTTPGCWAASLLLVLSGLLVLLGLLTPVASLLQGMVAIAFGLSWLYDPGDRLFAAPFTVALFGAISLALALLGPGSISLDSQIFGRREIRIPRGRKSSS